jgi:bacterioferritin-associated ferredoxin
LDTLDLVIVCICRGVSDRQVRLTVLNGASTIKEVAAQCQAGRGCGACHEQIEGMIAEVTCPANDCPAHDNRQPAAAQSASASGSAG